MAYQIIKERDDLISRLNSLNSETESIYNALAEDFPRVLSETELSLDNAFRTISFYSDKKLNLESNSSEKDKLKILINKINDDFAEIHREDDKILKSLNDSLSYIKSLTESIDLVRKSSENMELISLNAMTYAIKAGKSGGAFSYITEELKRISSKTIEETDSLTSRGTHARKLFSEYLIYLRELQTLQKKTIADFTARIIESGQNLDSGISGIVQSMNHILETGKTIKVPLIKIMEEIQQQDIIRQTIDHVLITLNSIEEKDFKTDDEALDEFIFITNISELSISLLEGICRKLENSRKVFKDATSSIESIFKETESRKNDFVRKLNSNNQGVLSVMFCSSQKKMKSLFQDLSFSIHKKERISSQTSNLFEEVERISEGFEDLENLVSKFNNISVASKIEISKQEILKQMESTVDDMDGLINSIEVNISESRDITKNFYKITRQVLDTYFLSTEKEHKFIFKYRNDINIACTRLNDEIQSIEKTLGNFRLFSDAFYQIYSETSSHLWNLDKIIAVIKQIIRKYQKIAKNARLQKDNIMISNNIENRELRNNRLQSIIKDFTIFHHKKKAADLEGFSVEGGTDEGEITFF